jgi:UrcA family protein
MALRIFTVLIKRQFQERRMNIKTTYSNARKFQLVLGMIGGCLIGSMIGRTAAADPLDDVPTVVVKYDTMSLSTEPGIRALYLRLESAASRVCDVESNRDLTSTTVAKNCREAALDRAVRQINNPRLAEIRMGNSKRG